ncbi:SDR family NAD(P)-dependent oxidoreductase [Acidovorax sp. A1169]|uniref:SDR family NAD(P)-dependent oxidoreductase n=1 Tax=Acidovorax sp. A1169 TaxID=3059524 RepID=UPI00273780B5|nr:SDR family oxidoreductase [Acidovorax sp. A1169]MDP4075703.1 SDR family oxidoreductase [Acidovorax sp. A1169]
MTTSNPFTAAARGLYGLEGKRILVTGASQGIGRAVALSCAEAGAQLVLTGRDAQRLQSVVDSLASTGHQALPVDLTDMSALRQLVVDCGLVDGVVHSAGIRGLSPMKMVGDGFLREVMETNYIAPMVLTRQLLSRSAIRAGGSILFLSSIAALTGTVGLGPYAGSKAALIGTMRPLALELSKRGIRANALAPGIVQTPLTTIDADWFDAIRKRYPLDVGQTEDVAWACLFFLSDASKKVTGTVFSLDGGVEYT